MLQVPVFHVNGEDPEAVIQVAQLAVEFRQRFEQDVVIDMYCYRKYGHNEGDEPRFTQPLMYALIDKKPTRARGVRARASSTAGQITREQAEQIASARARRALERRARRRRARATTRRPPRRDGRASGAPYRGGPDARGARGGDRGSRSETLLDVARRAARAARRLPREPEGRCKLLEQRRERDDARNGQPLDWGAGEHLAFASLLAEGTRVRLSGQDARRGTFRHRHAVLFDVETGEPYAPLANLGDARKRSRSRSTTARSPRPGVLGFEYGYSLDCPDALVHLGGAVRRLRERRAGHHRPVHHRRPRTSGTASRGLVLLLPHGYEGQGPEHSSARLERFLQLCAEDNMQVCNLTTPAQLFHVLRRQVLRPWRKPLVIMSRRRACCGTRRPCRTLDEISPTGASSASSPTSSIDGAKVEARPALQRQGLLRPRRRERGSRERDDVAIVRLEQLYPLERASSSRRSRATATGRRSSGCRRSRATWAPGTSSTRACAELLGDRLPLSLVSRAESASPATGSKASHDLEQKMLVEAAFGAG